jgi:quaternary ammonium compound-resistance protein SugE
VFRRRWLGSVVFLMLGGAVGLRLVMLGLMGLSFVMLSLVVFTLGLLSLVVFALRLFSLVVFTLGLLSLVVFTLGLLSLVVFALGLLSLAVFALGLFSLVVFTLGLFAFVVFTGPDLGRIVRVPVIDRVALVLVMPSLFLMGALSACRLDTPTLGRFLLGRRPGVDPSWTVEADVIIDGRLVDHCTVHIGIVDG